MTKTAEFYIKKSFFRLVFFFFKRAMETLEPRHQWQISILLLIIQNRFINSFIHLIDIKNILLGSRLIPEDK